MWTYQHQHFIVHQLPVLRDNYIYIIQDRHSPVVCVVDPALAQPVIEACKQHNITPTHILNTHHHWDHTDGNKQLVETYQCAVVGNQADASRIPYIKQAITANSHFSLGHLNIQSLEVNGHTLGHIAFVIDDALFCGDTLFGAGCGRLFEGSFAQMWESLQKLAELDQQTKVYCAHEYTLVNLAFAQSVDADNNHLQQRIDDDKYKRLHNQPTIPSTIGLEVQTNPFLRPLDPTFCLAYSQTHQTKSQPLQVFTSIREARNNF
ncbi:hydroxyacylglutathione hydrolase [Ghiorsea bivora]|uniref:hydroxyacylglutathione hydrolase n=1 Tax=Ghiorsea bivora TaxID=1485545 RepID=UPI00057073D3|nr:hydroxyacylglutathione hydrolase [Ghiorsea bivora]